MVKLIAGKAPELVNLLKNQQQPNQAQGSGLEAITEEALENEETTDNDFEDEESEEEEEDDSESRKNKYDQEDLDEDMEEYDDNILDADDNVHVVNAPKLIKCEEDDEFVNMFDKMMNETLNENKATVPRSQQMDIVAPVHLRQHKKPFSKFTKICNLWLFFIELALLAEKVDYFQAGCFWLIYYFLAQLLANLAQLMPTFAQLQLFFGYFDSTFGYFVPTFGHQSSMSVQFGCNHAFWAQLYAYFI